eukprot:gene8257-25648_t
MLLRGATRRDRQHRLPRSASTEPSPSSAAEVDVAMNHALSPAVRAQSGEFLRAIQPAAARWRQAMAKVVAVGRFATAGAEGGGGGGSSSSGESEFGKSARTGGVTRKVTQPARVLSLEDAWPDRAAQHLQRLTVCGSIPIMMTRPHGRSTMWRSSS